MNVRPPTRSSRGKLLRNRSVSRFGHAAVALCRRLPPRAWLVLGLAAIAALPFLATPYGVGIVTLCFIWAVFAIGVNVALGYVGMPSLGHAVFFGSGAYAVALIGSHTGVGGWPALVLAIGVSALMAVVVACMVLRTKQVQLLLATVAAGQVMWGIAVKWRSLTGGDDGTSNPSKIFVPGFEGLSATNHIYIISAVVFIAVCIVAVVLDGSRFRRLLNGVRENEVRMATLGYDTGLYRFGAFVISGTISGIGGALFAHFASFVSPDLLSIATSGQVLLMVIVGGAGTLAGPVVGAFTIILLKEFLSGWTDRWQAIYGLLFIVVALLSRQGLMGVIRGWR